MLSVGVTEHGREAGRAKSIFSVHTIEALKNVFPKATRSCGTGNLGDSLFLLPNAVSPSTWVEELGR